MRRAWKGKIPLPMISIMPLPPGSWAKDAPHRPNAETTIAVTMGTGAGGLRQNLSGRRQNLSGRQARRRECQEEHHSQEHERERPSSNGQVSQLKRTGDCAAPAPAKAEYVGVAIHLHRRRDDVADG